MGDTKGSKGFDRLIRMGPFICILLALAGDVRKAQREFEQGIHLEQAGHWQEAYDAFSASINEEPTAPAYLHRAKTELALELPAKAVDDLTESIRLEPKDPEALRWRSETYSKLGNDRGVIADLTAVFVLGVESSALRSQRAAALAHLGQHQLAADDYAKAIRLRLDDPAAWKGRGTEYSALGNYRDAIDDFTQAAMLKPDDTSAY